MKIQQHKDAVALGRAAAAHGARELRAILARQPRANLIVATGASQFETLKHLVKEPGIDWTKVTVFHLDEYVGLPEAHGASFRKYLRERFIDQLPARPEFVPVDADAPDLAAELRSMALPFEAGTVPSDAELRVAQAQLVGWLEGLFHGIQATLFAQQIAARQQLEQMRGQLGPGGMRGMGPDGLMSPEVAPGQPERPGTYL